MLLHCNIHQAKTLPEDSQGLPLTVIGSVASIPEYQDTYAVFEFAVKQVSPENAWTNPGKIRLKWLDAPETLNDMLHIGDEWQFAVKLKRPRAYANPGSFDKAHHFFCQRLLAEGVLLDAPLPKLLQSSIYINPIGRMRELLNQNINISLKDDPYCGMINALVVGVRNKISQTQWEVFRDTGTVHLMAIAGLHIGFLTTTAFFLINFFWRRLPLVCLRFPSTWIAAIGAVLVAMIYAFLAGFSIPTQRALVMITIFMTGILTRRVLSSWRSFMLAMLIVLLIDPFSTLSTGFWLSFGAVFMILYGLRGRIGSQGLWWRWGRIQWVLFLGLIPLTLASFQQASFIAPLANFIAVPWVGFLVIPLSLLGAALSIVYLPLGALFLKLAAWLMSILWPILVHLSHWPAATWMNAELNAFALICAALGVLLILAPRGLPGRGFAIVFLLPLVLTKAPPIENDHAKFTVLDVGQGLAAVIETAHHVLLYDTGPKMNEHFDTGDRVVLPFLATRGIRKIDTVVISHGDNDHVGGLGSIINKLPVSQILTSETAKLPENAKAIKIRHCYAGQTWEWDGVKFEMLHPGDLLKTKRNDYSCVLRVRVGEKTVLLTGDIEAKSEEDLVARYGRKLQSDILLVPHHGSKTSSTLDFIKAVDPEYAVIPVGYRNQYGHPRPEVVERYQKQGIILLDTAHAGMVSFLIAPNKLQVPQLFLNEHTHYWHQH